MATIPSESDAVRALRAYVTATREWCKGNLDEERWLESGEAFVAELETVAADADRRRRGLERAIVAAAIAFTSHVIGCDDCLDGHPCAESERSFDALFDTVEALSNAASRAGA
jgi:hypothetical protein